MKKESIIDYSQKNLSKYSILVNYQMHLHNYFFLILREGGTEEDRGDVRKQDGNNNNNNVLPKYKYK